MQFTLKAVGGKVEGMPDLDSVRQALALLVDPSLGVELRALPFGKSVTGKCEDSSLIDFVTAHNDAKGIYYTLNPISPDLSRSANDGHILKRRWFLIDIDPKRPPDTNSSEAEHDFAGAAAGVILSDLVEAGWPMAVLIDSGNGWHLLFRIDLPNDDESKSLVKGALKALSKKYSDEHIELDSKVYNASRISKLPGTWARKGPHSPERPHRLCRLVSAPDPPTVLSADQLRRLLPTETNGPASPPAASPEEALRRAPKMPWVLKADADPGRAAYAKRALELETARVVLAPVGSRNDTLNKAAFALGQLVAGGVLSRSDVEEALTHAASRAGLSGIEVSSTIRSGIDGGTKEPRTAPERNGKPGGKGETVHERQRPTTFSLTELLAMDIPEPRWAVPGLLSEGLTLLAGKPKIGKSWLALNLAITIAGGGTALGMSKVVPGDVLYLALEDRPRRIQSRARKLLKGLDCAATDRLRIATAWPRLGDGGEDYIEEWAASVPRPSLVVIDVWAKFRPVYKQASNQYDQDYQHGAAIKDVADKFGFAALPLHHTKKAAAEDIVDDISGTLGIAGAADGITILTRARGETEGELFVTGRDVDERQLGVSFDPETFAWKHLGDAAIAGNSKARKAILTALQNNTSMTATEVADATNMERDTIRKELWRMLQAGTVRKIGSKYILPAREPDW